MSLYQKLKEDLNSARKERDSFKTNVLSTVIGELERKGKSPSESEVYAVIKKMHNDACSIANMTCAGSCSSVKSEMSLLESYLPSQLSEQELSSVISGLKAGGMSIGQIMAFLKINYSGRYDGALASRLAK